MSCAAKHGAAGLRAAKRYGWTRTSPPGRKVLARWEHPSGMELRHCGHPTALHPYYATDPARPEIDLIVNKNGKGFDNLEHAFEALEGLIRGRFTLRIEESTRYGTVGVLDMGERAPREEQPS